MNGSCKSMMLTHSQRPFNPFFVPNSWHQAGKISSPPSHKKLITAEIFPQHHQAYAWHTALVCVNLPNSELWSTKYELCVRSQHRPHWLARLGTKAEFWRQNFTTLGSGQTEGEGCAIELRPGAVLYGLWKKAWAWKANLVLIRGYNVMMFSSSVV